LTSAALTSLLLKVRVWPTVLVRVPGPFTVLFDTAKARLALSKFGVKFAVVLDKDTTPVPVRLPACKLKLPPLTRKVRPLPMSSVPVVVKVGVVPGWLTVRLPPTRLMVPLLRWAAELLARVKLWLTVSVPWLSSWALRLRDPPPLPGTMLMTPSAALLRLPLVTKRLAAAKAKYAEYLDHEVGNL
jgi:hypothetical protein